MKTNPLLLLTALSAIIYGCSGSKNDAGNSVIHNVFVTSPQPVRGDAARTYSAVAEEARSISVGFKTAGQIERIMVKEGDHVRRGQLLAVLDTVDYALGVSQLREQYSRQADELERQTKLHAAGNMSENDYLKAVSGLRQLRLQLELNENKLKYCRLTSSADGIITKVNYEQSEMVDAGNPVFELMDNSLLEVNVDLPVSEYRRREQFNGFTAILPGGATVPLTFLSLTPKADNNQLYRLKLTLPPSGSTALTPGMNLSVRIAASGSASGAVTVPARAVFDRDGRESVWVFSPADSTITARAVVTSGTGADGTLTVTEGLSDSDIIVRAGVRSLRQGEKVHVIEPASDTNVGAVL